MTRQEARHELRTWVTNTTRTPPADLRDDTPILEQRIITSLDVAELVLFLEDLRGKPIDYTLLNGASLRSVDAICTAFLADFES
ncbi:MAG TPA: hypothetical protein VGI39_29640 [Polyangiaceae bacterium]|jgi:acyl carrier protein